MSSVGSSFRTPVFSFSGIRPASVVAMFLSFRMETPQRVSVLAAMWSNAGVAATLIAFLRSLTKSSPVILTTNGSPMASPSLFVTRQKMERLPVIVVIVLNVQKKKRHYTLKCLRNVVKRQREILTECFQGRRRAL